MDVDSHPEASGLARDVAEEEIFERLVIAVGWFAAGGVLRVDLSRGRGRDLREVERTEIGGLELDRDAAFLPLRLERGRYHRLEVGVQRRGALGNTEIGHIASQVLRFEQIEHIAI